MIMVNSAGTIVLCNREVERLFGYPREALLGLSIEVLVPSGAQARHPQFRANFLAHPSARPMGVGRELFGVRKDGSQVPVEIGLNPIDMDGELFVLASVVDITERRRAAAERDELVRRLVDLQNRERRDLAHELHDEMGQMLTALKLMLESQGLGGVDDMKAMVHSLQDCVRRIATSLHPSVLEELGLLPTLLWHFPRYTQQTGIRVDFAHEGLDRRFSSRLEIAAFRIVQEALTNVARHAQVSATQVTVRARKDQLVIQVHDAGPGFDVARATQSAAGAGLLGMLERAQALNGRLSVESRPGSGVVVTAELPLDSRVP